MKYFIIILVLGLVSFLVYSQYESDKEGIKKWAIENNMEVKSIDIHVTTIGTPFFYKNKNQHIYEVDMTNGDKWWVRTGLLGNDYEKEVD